MPITPDTEDLVPTLVRLPRSLIDALKADGKRNFRSMAATIRYHLTAALAQTPRAVLEKPEKARPHRWTDHPTFGRVCADCKIRKSVSQGTTCAGTQEDT